MLRTFFGCRRWQYDEICRPVGLTCLALDHSIPSSLQNIEGRCIASLTPEERLAAMFRQIALYQNKWITPGQALADLGLRNRVP